MRSCILTLLTASVLAFSAHRAVAGDPKLPPSSVKVVRSLTGFKGDIDSVRFSPSGREVLSVGVNEMILWDVESGRILKKHPLGGGVHTAGAIFLGDQKHILIGDRTKPLALVDLEKWSEVAVFPQHSYATECMDVSENGEHILTGGTKEQKLPRGSLLLWSTKERKLIRSLEGHIRPVKRVVFVPGKFQALSQSNDGTHRLWDLANGKEIGRLGKPVNYLDDTHPRSLAIFKDGKSFTTDTFVIELPSFAITRKLNLAVQQRSNNSTCVAISPNQKLIAVGNQEGQVRLWSAETGKEIDSFYANTNKAVLHSIGFSADGQFIVTGGRCGTPGLPGVDHTIRIWKLP